MKIKRLVPDEATKDQVIRIFNLYYQGNSYQIISNLYNKEKIFGKTNWCDGTILKIIENEIYKGDFIHGKRTKNPTYYPDVVEPLVSKELWEECQVQKKKNSRNYKRDKEYLFLQKLKCPKCERILGGNATRKKNGNVYYYYQCHDCKVSIKETDIEKEKKNFSIEMLFNIFETNFKDKFINEEINKHLDVYDFCYVILNK